MNMSWQRIKNELRNPRKAGLLVVLVAVSLLLWGRLLLKQVPQTASAVPATSVSETASILAEPIMPLEADKPVVRLQLTEALPRDLFALKHLAYVPTKDAITDQEAEKSAAEPVDDKARFKTARQAAAELNLQSIVTGGQPRAVINGQMLALGQRIEGFALVRIAERFVLVERDGVIVRIDL